MAARNTEGNHRGEETSEEGRIVLYIDAPIVAKRQPPVLDLSKLTTLEVAMLASTLRSAQLDIQDVYVKLPPMWTDITLLRLEVRNDFFEKFLRGT